ncbi:MFS transporter [Kitasatospora cinereorecta]
MTLEAPVGAPGRARPGGVLPGAADRDPRRFDRERRHPVHPERTGLHPGQPDLGVQRVSDSVRGFLAVLGRMVDLFGGRRLLLIGTAVFTVFSFVGGIAPNAATLVLGRAGQGFGGAIIASATLAVLSSTFTEPVERAKAFALWGAASGSGGAIGVLSGGAIVEWMSWRWVFLVNLPLGLLIAGMALMSVTGARAASVRRRSSTCWGPCRSRWGSPHSSTGSPKDSTTGGDRRASSRR